MPNRILLTAAEHCFARTLGDPSGPMGDEHSWALIGIETVPDEDARLVTVYYWASRKDRQPLTHTPPVRVDVRSAVDDLLGLVDEVLRDVPLRTALIERLRYAQAKLDALLDREVAK